MGIFTTIFYQPVYNALILIYLGLGLIYPNIDMGIAVIALTIVIRVLLLPLALSSDRSAKEKYSISRKLSIYKKQYSHDPITYKKKKKELLTNNRRIVISEIINLSIQVIVAIVFWKIFTSGLSGNDFHLLYKFVPTPDKPFNLIFLGKYDLTIPNLSINLFNSTVIFVAELLLILASPFKATRRDGITLIVLPIMAFIFFSQMPAGKKLFVLTSLIFTILLTLAKILTYLYYKSRGFLSRTAKSLQKNMSQSSNSKSESHPDPDEPKPDEPIALTS